MSSIISWPKSDKDKGTDMLDMILSYVENTNHARETPEAYLSYLYQLLELYSEHKEGHINVMPGKTEDYKERVGEAVIRGMNELRYKIKIVKDDSQKGKLNVAPEVARLFGGSVVVNDSVSLDVVPDSKIEDPFSLKMSYRDAIKIFGIYANKKDEGYEIEGRINIKRQKPKKPETRELSIDEIKKLTTYKDRVPYTPKKQTSEAKEPSEANPT